MMNDTTYVGMRYVPVFADPPQWDISRQFENLTMVTVDGETYISKKLVPTGVAITNEEYWVKISVPSGGSSGGGISYTTEEQNTGLKWIDGRTIYQKTYVFENLYDVFGQDFEFVDSNLTNCMLIKGWNIWYNPTDSDYKCVTNTAVQYGLFGAGKVKMTYGPQVAYALRDGKKGYITLQYIKLSETPNI